VAKRVQSFELSTLAGGMAGLTPTKGRELAEAAGVCLAHQRHQTPVELKLGGRRKGACALAFEPPTDQARRTHADLQEATESGACAVAIVVVRAQTGLDVIERSRKGTGFDYWLGKEPGVFEARLEVSGILSGSTKQVSHRVSEKLGQMAVSDVGGLPGYAAVVEFGAPRLHVERR